jgi:DNA polymerase V
MPNSLFALVDCNNFYASCERVFNPALEGKPIIVLSSNDGCIIARSNEAKAFGIPMGKPFYQYKELCQQHRIVVFSSNFELYGDMSDRVMQTLQHFCADMEIYSIDEAFLNLNGFTELDATKYMQDLRAKVKQWTGIPVSIGIAQTKVLAKMANHVAKKQMKTGVCSLIDQSLTESILNEFKVGELWGVGYRTAAKYRDLGITTAKQLRDADIKFIRKYFGVVGERIVYELRGISCFSLEEVSEPRKNILSSQSFGRKLTDIDEISEALANYAVRACEKLRDQNSKVSSIYVFLKTSMSEEKNSSFGTTHTFEVPTHDIRLIIANAKRCLQHIYQPGLSYRKTGILLYDLIEEDGEQQDLFTYVDHEKTNQFMDLFDRINNKMGKHTIFFAAQGTNRTWRARLDKRSPRYTTCWDELARVSCRQLRMVARDGALTKENRRSKQFLDNNGLIIKSVHQESDKI